MNEQGTEHRSDSPDLPRLFLSPSYLHFPRPPLHPSRRSKIGQDCQSCYLSLHPLPPPPHPSVLHLQQKESEGNKGEGQVLYKKGGERMSTVSLVLMLPLSNFYLWRKKKEKRTLVHVWLKGTTGRKEGRRGTAGEPGYNMFVRHLSINADIAGAHSEGGQRVAAGGRGAASCRGLPKRAEEEGALPSLKRGC